MRKEREAIAIVVAVFALFVLLVNSASADSITVTGHDEPLSKTFTTPKSTTPYFYASTSITITNNLNETITYSVSDSTTEPGITITPSSGSIDRHDSVQISLTIKLESTLSKGVHTGRVKVVGHGEPHEIDIPITIEHKAELKVPPTPVTFDTIGANGSTSKLVTFSETLGYKSIVVSLTKTAGNEWVTASPNSFKIDAGGSEPVTFSFAPRGVTRDNCVRYHSWTYRVSSTEEGAGSYIIDLKGEICCPAKLSYDHHPSTTTITFNRPKTEHHTYQATAKIKVSNTGCQQMPLNPPRLTSPSGGISLSVKNYPSYVNGYSSGYIEIAISAPYDAPEGTYYGYLDIDAGGAGYGKDVPIPIVILWPVDFTISSTSPYFSSSPLSIEFNSLELKETGYDTKRLNLTLTEYYGYKPVEDLRLSSSDAHSDWLKEVRAFVDIPAGESRNVRLTIEPGLEAVPKYYSWKYYISARGISAKRIDITAKVVPMNINEMLKRLQWYRNSLLYRRYPSSEGLISNGVELLRTVDRSNIEADDWQRIPVLTKGSLSLLSSLNDSIVYSDAENYGKTVEALWTARVSTSIISVNSKLSNWDLSGYANGISIGADRTTNEVLTAEAKRLELRGWNIKKAVEHAMPTNDVSKLKENETVLESAFSYQYAATLYGLLNDKGKRLDCVYEESHMMAKHDELVGDATDLRIQAENSILNSQENDLSRFRDTYLLTNPYNYDTASWSYKTAEKYLEVASKKYRLAGELLMAEDTETNLNKLRVEWRYILSLFLMMCMVYGVALIYVLTRIIRGTMTYVNDMQEREIGDVVVS
ncbi:MAG: hypothetical protein WAV32_10425 [Halobacteriota archaeon]